MIASIDGGSATKKAPAAFQLRALFYTSYIIFRNTTCAIWKYRIKLQASTMVVMKGVAMMAGSAPSFLAARGSIPPTSFARMTLKSEAKRS